MWLSDDASDRAQAASWCVGCPVLVECGAAADEHGERFGTWGGTDRTVVTPKLKRGRTVPRRNRAPRPRTRAAQVPPPERQSTPPQLAQRLVSRGLAAPRILEPSEALRAAAPRGDRPEHRGLTP